MLPDPSTVFRPVPLVAWQRPAPRPPIPARGRAIGAALGLVIGLMIDAIGLWVVGSGLLDPSAGAAGDPASAIAGAAGLGAIVAATGAVGGWIVAPQAWRAQDRVDWGVVIIELAFAAVIIGALFVGQAGMAAQLPYQSGPLIERLVFGVAAGGALALVGIALFGIFVLPFTLAASLVWAVGMWVLKGRGWRR